MIEVKVVKPIVIRRKDGWTGILLTLPKVAERILNLQPDDRFTVLVDLENKAIVYKLQRGDKDERSVQEGESG